MSSRVRALLLLLLLVLSAEGQLRPRTCNDELIDRWNKFADDTKTYLEGWQAGVRDMRMRSRLDKEWRAVTSCECW